MPHEGRNIYKVIWSQEVGIHFLKHVCGTRDPLCRDCDRAVQEVWGRLALAASGAEDPEPGPKHERAIDVTMAFKAFPGLPRGREDVDVEKICGRHAQSVREGRSCERRKSKELRASLCYHH